MTAIGYIWLADDEDASWRGWVSCAVSDLPRFKWDASSKALARAIRSSGVIWLDDDASIIVGSLAWARAQFESVGFVNIFGVAVRRSQPQLARSTSPRGCERLRRALPQSSPPKEF